MPNLKQYNHLIPFRLHGIPCQIGVKYFFVQKPDHTTWSSDWDYHGYTESDYDILDRRGYPAKWLESKGVDDDEVVSTIEEYYKNSADDYDF